MNKFLFFLLLFSSMTFAQTPCVGGFAGIYPCNGVDLMAHMPISDFGSSIMNDSWGWEDPDTGKEYALVGLGNGTAFIDISDPANPIYLGKLPTHTSGGGASWRDIKVYNNYAFVVSEISGHGMQVFDLTRLRDVVNPPVTFTEDAHYNGFGSAHNIVINEDTGYAYSVGTSRSTSPFGGPTFINIQDPLNPVEAGSFSGSSNSYTHDAQVVTYHGPDTEHVGKEIFIGSNESVIVVVDVTDKSNPILLSESFYTDSRYVHQGWLTEDHRFYIQGDELDEDFFGFNTKSIVFDFQDLDNPQFLMNYFGPTDAIDHNYYVKGDYLFLANYADGVRIIDVSDLENSNMNEVEFFDTNPSNPSMYGVWNVYPYFKNGIFIASDETAGFFVLKSTITNTAGVEDQTLATDFILSPNPSKDVITVKTKNSQIESISVFDIVGEKLIDIENLNITNDYQLNISTLESGIYFMEINNELSKKFVVK